MTRRRRLTWRTALVAVALVSGLFALHALSHHGEHLPATTAAAPHADHAADHHQSAPADDSHEHGALSLCLAMLAGAAAWLLATAVRRRGSRPMAVLQRGAAGGVRLRAAGRAHAPPDLWDLSVCRC